MKSLIKAVAIAAVLAAAPVVSFAQSNPSGLTRAQVREELIQLEKAGRKEEALTALQEAVAIRPAERYKFHRLSAEWRSCRLERYGSWTMKRLRANYELLNF